jgi:hypothetical protein
MSANSAVKRSARYCAEHAGRHRRHRAPPARKRVRPRSASGARGDRLALAQRRSAHLPARRAADRRHRLPAGVSGRLTARAEPPLWARTTPSARIVGGAQNGCSAATGGVRVRDGGFLLAGVAPRRRPGPGAAAADTAGRARGDLPARHAGRYDRSRMPARNSRKAARSARSPADVPLVSSNVTTRADGPRVGDRRQHQHAAPRWAAHADQPGRHPADRDRLTGLRRRGARELSGGLRDRGGVRGRAGRPRDRERPRHDVRQPAEDVYRAGRAGPARARLRGPARRERHAIAVEPGAEHTVRRRLRAGTGA